LERLTRVAVVAIGAYVGAQVIADITSVKLGTVAGRAVDMGTYIYPITFTLRDVVHKAAGRRVARTVILTAAAVNLFMALYMNLVANAGTNPDSPVSGEQFSAVLAPVTRIVIASIIAEVVSELLDTEVYHLFVTRVTRRYQWARVALSNAISIPVDSLVFVIGAYASLPLLRDHFLTTSWSTVWDLFVVNLTVKAVVSAVSLPLIYVTPDRVRDTS
jgi:uncharacterized integral membrane protein (TIGR00697 family)